MVSGTRWFDHYRFCKPYRAALFCKFLSNVSNFAFIVRPSLNVMVSVIRYRFQTLPSEKPKCLATKMSPTVQMHRHIMLVNSILTLLLPKSYNITTIKTVSIKNR